MDNPIYGIIDLFITSHDGSLVLNLSLEIHQNAKNSNFKAEWNGNQDHCFVEKLDLHAASKELSRFETRLINRATLADGRQHCNMALHGWLADDTRGNHCPLLLPGHSCDTGKS